MKKILISLTVLLAIIVAVPTFAAGVCFNCGGSGECTACGGSGWTTEYDINGDSFEARCDECNGSGHCRSCDGLGTT